MTGAGVDDFIDVLMITYNRPDYVALSLPQLLEECDERTRVWLWHNGDDAATLKIVRQVLDHPRVAEFHHSTKNMGLRDPTNWLWANAAGGFVSKVDDDCLLPQGWARTLADAHAANPSFGVIAASRIRDEGSDPISRTPRFGSSTVGTRSCRTCGCRAAAIS